MHTSVYTQYVVLNVCCLSLQKKKDDDDDDERNQQVPRIFITFKDTHTYQLRAYIYQARDMYGSDKSGLSGTKFRPTLYFSGTPLALNTYCNTVLLSPQIHTACCPSTRRVRRLVSYLRPSALRGTRPFSSRASVSSGTPAK